MEEREVELGAAFPAGRDASPAVQPGVGAFDGPAVARLRVATPRDLTSAALDQASVGLGRLAAVAAAADHRLDPTRAQLLTEPLAVVAAVGPQLSRPPPLREQLVDERQEMQPFVLVAGADAHRQWRAVGVDG